MEISDDEDEKPIAIQPQNTTSTSQLTGMLLASEIIQDVKSDAVTNAVKKNRNFTQRNDSSVFEHDADTSDIEPPTKRKKTTNGQPQNAITTPNLNGLPLPMELVEHVTSFLGGIDHFSDRVRVAAICRQLRLCVVSNMRQMRGRYLEIRLKTDHILVGDIKVENNLLPPKDQMECVMALLEFGRPTNLLLLNLEEEKGRRLIDVHRILSLIPPPSITRLHLELHKEKFSDETPFNDIMEVIGGMTNLETLYLQCLRKETPASLAHRDSLPSVPEDSPFNHLLKLERLRGLAIDDEKLLSPEQQADLINRSPSTIRHLCCLLPTFEENVTMLESISTVVRANISSACCWDEPLPLLTNLPNCQSICRHYGEDDPVPTRQQIDELAVDFLNDCHDNDDRRGKTLQLKIGLYFDQWEKYLGLRASRHNKQETVVNVTIDLIGVINDADCPLNDPSLLFYL